MCPRLRKQKKNVCSASENVKIVRGRRFKKREGSTHLEEELEVEKRKRQTEMRRFEQLKAGSKAKDRRILSLERFVADMSKALQNARVP